MATQQVAESTFTAARQTYIDAAAAGDTVVITVSGTPVYEIAPLGGTKRYLPNGLPPIKSAAKVR